MPVVRRTGGLADTVKDVDAADAGDMPNGFTFDGVDEASEDSALDRALQYYRDRPEWWAKVCFPLLVHHLDRKSALTVGNSEPRYVV